jgi:RNA polymerase sigma-70 factor (ECF subfamily)
MPRTLLKLVFESILIILSSSAIIAFGKNYKELLSAGDRSGAAKLMELVYDDLRGLAHKKLGRNNLNHSLDPTAVVHEVFIKLFSREHVDWKGKSHFYAVSASAMRDILVDYARQRAAQKRGGNRQRIPLSDAVAFSPQRDEDVLTLDDALKALAEVDPQRAQIVELRFFGGLTVKEVAETLGIAERTVGKQWATVRLWLRKYMTENSDP